MQRVGCAEGGAEVDVFVLGRKQTVPDEVRSLAQAKVARLAV